MAKRTYRRTVKLPSPRFQLRLVGVFVLLSLGSQVAQLFLLGQDLRLVAEALPPGNALSEETSGILTRAFLFGVGMWLPVTLGVGILVTHRIAGPVYRFERHLEAVARGEDVGPCRIRRGDEFQDLCDRLNDALAARAAVATTVATPALADGAARASRRPDA